MSSSTFGLKSDCSGWWGSKKNTGGAPMMSSVDGYDPSEFATPIACASTRACSAMRAAAGWSPLYGSASGWVSTTVGCVRRNTSTSSATVSTDSTSG